MSIPETSPRGKNQLFPEEYSLTLPDNLQLDPKVEKKAVDGGDLVLLMWRLDPCFPIVEDGEDRGHTGAGVVRKVEADHFILTVLALEVMTFVTELLT